MEEGTVASWLKNVGDFVQEGDILAEIETDKQRWNSNRSTKEHCFLQD